jgi:hypothetical protein
MSKLLCWKALTPYLGPQINKNKRKAWYPVSIFVTRDWNFAARNGGNLQDRPPSKGGQLPTMMRLHPGAGVTVSWEPDHSPQLMIVITTFEPSKNKDWDNDPLEHSCDWDYWATHPDCPLPQFFLYLKAKITSVPGRWLKKGWMLTLPLLIGESWAV